MANTKISALTENTNPTGGEELVYAYNNANGKMTLNTMKGYVENNLSGFATTADLATKQDTLVSGTNIRTINGASVLGNGDIIVTGGTGYTAGTGIDITGGVISATGGGGGGSYDCVVDANGGGDYTTISDAITAGKQNIFIKNGAYTMSSGTLSTGCFSMTGESREGVVISVSYSTKSGVIFTLTSNTTDDNLLFSFNNLTFDISYTGAYGYFSLFSGFGMGEGPALRIIGCDIRVNGLTNGGNFQITPLSGNTTYMEGCLIRIYPTAGSFTAMGFNGFGDRSVCVNSNIILDASGTIGANGMKFTCNPVGTYIGCIFKVGRGHQKTGDIAQVGASYGYACKYQISAYANLQIYGAQYESSFSPLGQYANYDTALNTAVANKSITIWKPNTAYTVGQYVASGSFNSLAKCIEAHTSGNTFDSSKFEDVYGDVYVGGNLIDCDLTFWGTVIVRGLQYYDDRYVQPALLGNISNCGITFEKQSSSAGNISNLIILSNKGFDNNRIANKDNTTLHIYMGGESSTFIGNRIASYTGDIYSGGYGNIITNNIFAYTTGQTTPTITQVTSGLSEIANNVIRGVDW